MSSDTAVVMMRMCGVGYHEDWIHAACVERVIW